MVRLLQGLLAAVGAPNKKKTKRDARLRGHDGGFCALIQPPKTIVIPAQAGR